MSDKNQPSKDEHENPVNRKPKQKLMIILP